MIELDVEVREVCTGLWEVALGDSVIFRGPKAVACAIARANRAVIDERTQRELDDDK